MARVQAIQSKQLLSRLVPQPVPALRAGAVRDKYDFYKGLELLAESEIGLYDSLDELHSQIEKLRAENRQLKEQLDRLIRLMSSRR